MHQSIQSKTDEMFMIFRDVVSKVKRKDIVFRYQSMKLKCLAGQARLAYGDQVWFYVIHQIREYQTLLLSQVWFVLDPISHTKYRLMH